VRQTAPILADGMPIYTPTCSGWSLPWSFGSWGRACLRPVLPRWIQVMEDVSCTAHNLKPSPFLPLLNCEYFSLLFIPLFLGGGLQKPVLNMHPLLPSTSQNCNCTCIVYRHHFLLERSSPSIAERQTIREIAISVQSKETDSAG
jgi:hypothetical protein